MLLVDTQEKTKDQLVPLIRQSIPCEVANLNGKGLADYFWVSEVDGHSEQMNHKQGGEVLGSIPNTEDQLRRELHTADRLWFCVQDIIVPDIMGTAWYNPTKEKGNILVKRGVSSISYAAWRSWTIALEKSGITYLNVVDINELAQLLVLLYKDAQKEEHTVLRRYIKPKIEPWVPNQHVLSLMGIQGANLGPIRAKALVARFGTFWNVVNASIEELAMVDGMGRGLARNLLERVGRSE